MQYMCNIVPNWICCRPSPSISWQRQSGTWDASRYEQKDFDTRLNIKQVAESDADTYICRGSNSAGSDVSYSMTLAVKGTLR